MSKNTQTLSTFDRDPYDYRCTSVESLQELMDKIDEKTFIKKLSDNDLNRELRQYQTTNIIYYKQ